MKRWALITVVLYLATLLILTFPVWLDCFWWGSGSSQMSADEILEVFKQWGYWLWIGASVASQILLLIVPVKSAERRPVSRRHLLVPVLT